MQITITEDAHARILKYLDSSSKIILNFDDGVGELSNSRASCSLDLHFELVIASQSATLTDYSAEIETTVGTFYAKPYSLKYLDQNNTIKVGASGALTLSGEYAGVIDGNLTVKDLRS
ncbi:iron-sulfur cluster biosynthesis family protein [Listeria costaricensis]|uniref:iron-sulfur cluster biosynthesis family protein n=1 Tax=Listeria costaricensis TaxID=2026604 RepID=UPI0013C52622|nr:iron-sulfur cluster biosynthesis family protein [Listeria costaricensis]